MNKFLTLLACFLLPTILTSIIIYAGIRMNRVMMIPENIEKDNIPLSVSDMIDVNEDSERGNLIFHLLFNPRIMYLTPL